MVQPVFACCLACHRADDYCNGCEDIPCCSCPHRPECDSCRTERVLDDYFVNGYYRDEPAPPAEPQTSRFAAYWQRRWSHCPVS